MRGLFREMLVSLCVAAITLSVFAVAIAIGLLASMAIGDGSWLVGAPVSIVFLLIVFLRLRLLWMTGNAREPKASRLRRLQVSRRGFVLLAAPVLSGINAGSVLHRISSFSRASPGLFALQIVMEVTLLWCAMAALVLPAVFNNRILKVWTLLLVSLGFIASYYVVRLNVGIDMSVINSILRTDQEEVVEFIDPLGALLFVAVVGTTAVALARTSITSGRQVIGKIVLTRDLVFLTIALFFGIVSSHHAFAQIDTRFFKTG